MLEMASLGAQVMQARSIEVAKKFDVPIYVRSSFSNKPGTMIIKEVKRMEDVVVSAVTLNRNEAKITICNVPDKPGVAAKIFKELAGAGVNVDIIVQILPDVVKNILKGREIKPAKVDPRSPADKSV